METNCQHDVVKIWSGEKLKIVKIKLVKNNVFKLQCCQKFKVVKRGWLPTARGGKKTVFLWTTHFSLARDVHIRYNS